MQLKLLDASRCAAAAPAAPSADVCVRTMKGRPACQETHSGEFDVMQKMHAAFWLASIHFCFAQ